MVRTTYDNQGRPYTGSKPVTRTLHLMHHSMQFDDPPAQFSADIRLDLSRSPDILTIGEMNRFRTEIASAAQDYGYLVSMNPNIEEAILVKQEPHMVLKNYDYIKVLNQFGKTLQPPWYSARYISWVRVTWYDLPIYVHTQHWVAHIDDYPQFLPAHVKQTKAMGAQMKKHGEGTPVAFMSGDLNWDVTYTDRFTQATRPDLIFATYGCEDIYSELNVGRPATFHDGRTLDYVIKYLRDTNVKGDRFKVWPLGNSDHRALSVWYDIDFAQVQPAAVGGGGDEATSDPTTGASGDPDFYANAGDIDYSDYMDDATYMLTRVVEDSDLLRS